MLLNFWSAVWKTMFSYIHASPALAEPSAASGE